MSTGRVLWIIWCCAWAALWLLAAAWEWPRQTCGMYQVVDPGCMYTVTTGSAWGAVGLGALAAVSLAAIMLPVGQAHRNTAVRIWSVLVCGCSITEMALNFTGYGQCPVHGRQQIRFTSAKG